MNKDLLIKQLDKWIEEQIKIRNDFMIEGDYISATFTGHTIVVYEKLKKYIRKDLLSDRSDEATLLDNYSNWLMEIGYVDTKMKYEFTTAINRYLKEELYK
jgi:hypothetical protein